MIWATVSSRSCFCWLYRASPSLAAKNIISLISVLTIWWCSYVESSLVLLEVSWQNSAGLCRGSFCIPRPNFLLLQESLDFVLLHSIPLWWKGYLFWVFVLKGLVSLYRTIQLQLLQHYWLGHRLGLLWYWMVCLGTNRDHSVLFEIASEYCILDSFIDYDGYSISSRGILATIVDVMVLGVKFDHSSPF